MPRKGKLVVCATGDLAIPVLDAVIDAGHEIVWLLARPKRDEDEIVLPEERQGTALRSWARSQGIEISRASSPGGDRVRSKLAELSPDLGLVVAYGRRLPEALLEIPAAGWLKVHNSLLPKHRGLHPIRSAIWHGDRQAGASVIRVVEERDAGPVLWQERLDIGRDETFGELAPRVAKLGADLVGPALAAVLGGKAPKGRNQNEKSASVTPRFDRRQRLAPWWLEADAVFDRWRALSPEPGLTTRVRGRGVRILAGSPANHVNSPIGEAGSYIGLRSGGLAILCGNGTVFAIDSVEPDGEEPMSASDFARKYRLQVGNILV